MKKKEKTFTRIWVGRRAVLVALLLFIVVGTTILAQGRAYRKNRNFRKEKLALLSNSSFPYFSFSSEKESLNLLNPPFFKSSEEVSFKKPKKEKEKTSSSKEDKEKEEKEEKEKPIAEIDKEAPEVILTANPESPDGEAGFYTSSLILTLKTNEPAEIYYQIDSDEVKKKENEVEITFPEGIHTLTYYAIDSAGNKSEPEKTTYKVDLTNPLAEITFPLENEVYATSFYVLGKATDDNFTKYTLELEKEGKSELIAEGTSPVIDSVLGFIEEEGRKGEYTLRLTVTDESGRKKEKAISFTIDNGPPSPPSSLSVIAENLKNKITFTPSPSWDATAYKIYRSSHKEGPYTEIAIITGTEFYDPIFPSEKGIYYYKISSLDTDNLESSPTPPKSNERVEIEELFTPGEEKKVEAANGDLTFIVPKGALSFPTTITIKEEISAPEPDDFKPSSSPFLFSPSGLSFLTPATLSFSYDLGVRDESVENYLEEGTKIFYYDEEREKWTPLPSEVSTETDIVTASVPHFTEYWAGAPVNPMDTTVP
jgi:hypothetical protein